MSERVAGGHRDHGVRLLNGVGIAQLTGATDVDGVRLDDGTILPVHLVVVGVGARPATAWWNGSGVPIEHGAVLVDEDGRSSSKSVYAAGDVSAWWDAERGEHRRVEHYDSALVQGQRVAHSVLGTSPMERSRSWFWRDQ